MYDDRKKLDEKVKKMSVSENAERIADILVEEVENGTISEKTALNLAAAHHSHTSILP